MSHLTPSPHSDKPLNKSLHRWLVPMAIYVALLAITFLWAPNYRWSEEKLDYPFGSDFLQEWVGARMILTGNAHALYDAEVFRAWQHDPSVVGFEWNESRHFPPVYPPWHYALFVPLAMLPYRWAAMIWVALLWGMVFFAGILLRSIVLHSARELNTRTAIRVKQMEAWWLPILMFPAVPMSVMYGQKSLIWLAVFCLVARLLQKHREWQAGSALALLLFKPTLFYLVPLCMARYRRGRFLIGCGIGVALIVGISCLVLPWELWQGYIQAMMRSKNYGTQGGYHLDWSCNLWSIPLGLPEAWRIYVQLLVCIPLACMVVIALLHSKTWTLHPITVFQWMTATLLLSPHAYHYDLCILLLPIGWMAVYSTRWALGTFMILAFGLALATRIYPVLPVPILPFVLLGCSWLWMKPRWQEVEDLEGIEPAYGFAGTGDICLRRSVS